MRFRIAAIAGLTLTTLTLAQGQGAFTGEVTASKLNLRAGPGEAYQRVVAVEKGSRVIVIGRHPNNPAWYQVEVPRGYEAWVYGRFLARGQDDIGRVTAERLQIRPRPSTRYHQLAGYLRKGEQVKVRGMKETEEGRWYKIKVPPRIPLFGHAKYLKNIGPPSLAAIQTDEATKKPKQAGPLLTDSDKQFMKLEPEVREQLARAETASELEPLQQAVKKIDRRELSLDNRERRVKLLADIVDKERQITILELKQREERVRGELDTKLNEIERNYRKRLAVIRKEFEQQKSPRYVASGIVQWAPDIFGRHPEYRLEKGGKMRYFLIAPDYDLQRFVGKRVAVSGIIDPESGTGFSTVMIRRIEILGTE